MNKSTREMVHDARLLFEMNEGWRPSKLYISCDLLSLLMEEIRSLITTNLPDYSEEYLKTIKEFHMEYEGLDVFRIIDKGHIVVQ